MNKKTVFFLVTATTLSYLTTSFALDSTRSGAIVDNFKDRQKAILFDTMPFTESGINDILEQEYRMNGLDALKTRIAGVEEFYTEKKNETTVARVSLENTLKTIDTSIQATNTSIEQTQTSILEKKQKIQVLERASLELKKKIHSYRETILSYLANLYSEGNLIMDDSGQIDMMQALIMTDTDTDFHLTDMTYKSLVAQLGQKFVDDYRSLVREYYVNNIRTNEEKEGLENLELSLLKQKATLEAQKKERENLLEITKGQEALYIQYIAAQQEAQKTIETAWQKANDDYQASFDRFLQKYDCDREDQTTTERAECIRVRQFFSNEMTLAKSEYASGTENILTWPVESRRVTAYFRDPSYYRAVGSQHDAIDIGVSQGTPVHAPADGYVYYILAPAPGNYSYIALKHKNGLVTVYGHLSEVNVTPYQFVRQGEVIAKSGGAPGTPGAGPITTGAHLHFELWKNKEPVDPLRFMTVTDIDYTALPARYQSKFINDLLEKSGTGTNINDYQVRFRLKGDTEEARQKYLLSTYATREFQDWNMWVDTAIDANIDPSFLMCIGLSETTLGNHLKTPYNIGNVGNTDSGDTVTFSSAQEGITWMAKTFNNRFLGKYNKLSELSRWGNDSGAIYASSSSNWHDNSVRCLSALKGRFVEDDFLFRIADQKNVQ